MSTSTAVTLPRTRHWLLIANILLVSLGLYFAVMLYKEARVGFDVVPRFALLFAIALALIVWSPLGLRLSLDAKVRMCLVGASFGVGLVVVDLYIMEFLPSDVSRTFEEPLPVIDPRDKAAVLSDLRRSEPAYPAVVPSLFIKSNGLAVGMGRIFPLAGISRTMTVASKESGLWTGYVSDELGFNNPQGSHSTEAAPIVLVGDSFVHGGSVDAGDDFAAQMRRRGQAAVNLGMWANGPLIELATLTEYGLRLRPRVVFWFYFEENDLTDIAEERKAGLLTSYLNDGYSQRLADQQDLIDSLLKQYCDTEERQLHPKGHQAGSGSRGHDLLARVSNTNIARVARLDHLRGWLTAWLQHKRNISGGQTGQEDWILFRQVLEVAARRVKQAGAVFYFVYLPTQSRFFLGKQNSPTWCGKDKVMSIVKALNLPLVDMSEEFARHPDPQALFIAPYASTHYNRLGNQVVVQRCLNRLKADGF